MRYSDDRVRERIIFLLAKHEILRQRFTALSLLPEASVRDTLGRTRKVHLDMLYRFLQLHLDPTKPAQHEKITNAFLDVILSDEFKDESLLTLVRCDLRQLSLAEINPSTGHAYDDARLGMYLRAMRKHGFQISYRAMGHMEFSPSYTTIKSYEGGKTKPSLEYLFGILLRFRSPAKVILAAMVPMNRFREPGISLSQILLYKKYLKISQNERERLNELVRKNTTRKKKDLGNGQ